MAIAIEGIKSKVRDIRSKDGFDALRRALENHDGKSPFPRPMPIRFSGIKLMIENPKGSLRRGIGENGKPWQTRMQHHYGYVSHTDPGTDGDALDVFVGPSKDAKDVHIVHTQNPKTRVYDEDKCLIGFQTPQMAKAAFIANYDKSGPDRFRSMTTMPLTRFKEMLGRGKPGGVRWTRKQRREPEAMAMFSSEVLVADPDKSHIVSHEPRDASGRWVKLGGVNMRLDDKNRVAEGPGHLVGKTHDEAKQHMDSLMKLANTKQAELIGKYANNHGKPINSAAMEWIKKHANRFRDDFTQHTVLGNHPVPEESYLYDSGFEFDSKSGFWSIPLAEFTFTPAGAEVYCADENYVYVRQPKYIFRKK